MPADSHNAALSLLEDLIGKAKAAGADAADAVLFDGASLSLSQRLGQPERLERAEAGDLGLRVFIGKRQAIVSTTDRSKETLEAVVERAVAMARNVPEDPFNGLADPDQLAKNWPTDLEIDDPTEPSAEQMIEQARIAEEAAMAVPGVTNSEGAEASWSRSHVAIAASNGFAGAYSVSRRSLSVSVLAGTGTGMERDYDYSSKVFASDLAPADEIGRGAGEKAVRRLNPRKVKTCQVPVVYDPRVSRGLIGHLSGRHHRPVDRARDQLPEGQDGRAAFPLLRHHRGRSARQARAAVEAVRRGRGGLDPPEHHRGRAADDMAARPALGPPAWPDFDRARLARDLRPAVAGADQLLPDAG